MVDYIFYHDGEISGNIEYEGTDVIDARFGYRANMASMNKFLNDDKHHQVLTNQVALLKCNYCWDRETHRPNVLVKSKDGNWKNITTFTKQKVKYSNNLEAMYRVGVFDI